MKTKEEETTFDAKEKAQGGDSDQEMMNLENELYSLTHYADDEEELVAQMFATIKGSKLEAMMPPILKEIPLIDVQQLCLHELRGMSQRRILSIINGQEMSGSSSEDSDTEKKPNEANENETENSNIVIKVEKDTEDFLSGKDLSELENINESNLRTLDILELEMRAKLIKTMLEKQDGDGEDGKEEEEETIGIVPDIKIKEEPLTPESTHMEDNVPRNESPDSQRRSRYALKRKHRRRRDSRSYSSSSRSSSRSSYTSRSRSKSWTPSPSRSGSYDRSISYTPDLKKDGSESPKSKKTNKKKISKKEFEERMKKAKMNRSYRKRKGSEEDLGETAKEKQIANETEEPSENAPDHVNENNAEASEEKNGEQTEVGEEEKAEEGEVEEKEEGEIDSNEETFSRSSRSYSRSYSSDSYSSYSSSSSSSRSYSRSSRRRKSTKSKKKRRHRRHRSRSSSDVPKIPNWKPNESTVTNNDNLDSGLPELKTDTKPEKTKTLPITEERQSISFSIGKKSNATNKSSSELNEPNDTSTPLPEDSKQDICNEESNSKDAVDTTVENENLVSMESKDSVGSTVENEELAIIESKDAVDTTVENENLVTLEYEDVKPQVVEANKDFDKETDIRILSEGECEDKIDLNVHSPEIVASEDLETSKSAKSKKNRRRKKKLPAKQEEIMISEEPIILDSTFEELNDIPKDSKDSIEEVSQLSSLQDVGEDSTQDVLEPLAEIEAEDSRESHSLEIIGVIDPAEKREDTFDEDLAAGGSSWSMRWLQSEKVQKVVSNSKMLSKVRKKIQAKGKGIVKETPKAVPKQIIPVVEAKPESPKIEVKLQPPKTGSSVIGSIEEYEKLFGIKVKAPTSLPQPKPQSKPPSIQAVSILDSDDDEDSEEEAIWSKIMKK